MKSPSARNQLQHIETWILPALGLLVPLACWNQLTDAFELVKLLVLKAGLAVLLLILAMRGRLDLGLLRNPASIAVLIFLGLNILATILSVEPRTSFFGNYLHNQGLLTLAVQVGYFFAAAALVRTERDLSRFAAGMVLAAGVVSAYGIGQYLGFDPLRWAPSEDGRRTFGTLGNPNQLGEFLAMSVPLGFWLAWRGRGMSRDLPLWIIVSAAVALMLTQARTAWVVLFMQAVLIVPLVLLARWRARPWVARLVAVAPVLVALGFVATLVLAPASTDPVEDAAREALRGERGNPLQTRHYLWSSAFAATTDRPILGWGPDTFELVYPGYRSSDLDRWDGIVGRDDAVHNVLLTIGVNAGFLGMAAFLAVQAAVLLLLLRATFPSREAVPEGRAALAMLLVWISYFVLFMFGEPRVTTDWLAWSMGGAAVGLLGSRAGELRAMPRVLRLVPIMLAVALLAEATSAFGAEKAFAESRGAGSLESRASSLEQAVNRRPFEPTYHQELGLTLAALAWDTGDPTFYDRALAELTRASSLWRQRDAYLLSWIGRTMLEREEATGDFSDTPLTYAQQAIALDPRNPTLYATAAELAWRMDRQDQARELWEAARARAFSPDALQRVGEVAMLMGEPLAARDAFKDAIGKQWRGASFLAYHHRSLGHAALAADLPVEALDAFDEVLRLTEGDLETRVVRAELLAAFGDREEALKEAERVLDQDPDNERAIILIDELQ